MATCRTVKEAYAAGLEDSKNDPPLSQEQADLVAAIIASAKPEPEPQPKPQAAA